MIVGMTQSCGAASVTESAANDARLVQALAAVMTEADCASSEYPFSDESRARAILAAGWHVTPPARSDDGSVVLIPTRPGENG